jgi:hypothetical protein
MQLGKKSELQPTCDKQKKSQMQQKKSQSPTHMQVGESQLRQSHATGKVLVAIHMQLEKKPQLRAKCN